MNNDTKRWLHTRELERRDSASREGAPAKVWWALFIGSLLLWPILWVLFR